MYRIAIIDNDLQWAEQLHSMMRRVFDSIGLRKCSFELYSDSAIFLDRCEEDSEYFLILLDTNLEQVSGIHVAEKLRDISRADTIAFISSGNSFAMESYMVDAVSYVKKPLNEDQCYDILKRVIKSKRKKDWELQLRDGSRFRMDQLCYIKYQKTGFTISLENQETIQTKAAPEEIQRIAGAYCCLYPVGEDLVLNFLQVCSIEQNTVLFSNGHYIHLPRKMTGEVKKEYLQFQLEMMQG